MEDTRAPWLAAAAAVLRANDPALETAVALWRQDQRMGQLRGGIKLELDLPWLQDGEALAAFLAPRARAEFRQGVLTDLMEGLAPTEQDWTEYDWTTGRPVSPQYEFDVPLPPIVDHMAPPIVVVRKRSPSELATGLDFAANPLGDGALGHITTTITLNQALAAAMRFAAPDDNPAD
jgi:hypothetical protein